MSLKSRLNFLTARIISKTGGFLKTGDRKLPEKVKNLETIVTYLEYEVSRMSSLLRYVTAPIIKDLPMTRQTQESFDFQWNKLPKGRWNLENEDFRKEALGYVCQFTDLPPEWFKGKMVLDVGCGAGRYSWAMCKLGAEVLSIDKSLHGLNRTKQACKDFRNHRAMQVDLLTPLNIQETFDLVWCYGVLHHIGDTYGGFKKIVSLVRPGGYLFLMLYGEPRKGMITDYAAVNEYEYWRRKTRNMTLDERLEVVKQAMRDGKLQVTGEEYIEGYFDALSPAINDLYTWEEIKSWLLMEKFHDIKRTVEGRNHHIIARKCIG